jgi:phosphonate transport system permease protein
MAAQKTSAKNGFNKFTVRVREKSMSTKAIVFDAITFGYLILVGLFVSTNPSEATLMDVGFLAMLTAAAMTAGGLLGFGLNKMKIKTLGENIFEPAHAKVHASTDAWYKTLWGWQLLVAFVVTFIVGVNLTQMTFEDLFHQKGFMGAQRIFIALLNPEWALLPKGLWAIIETIYLAFMATVLALPVAFVLSFLSARNIMQGSWVNIVIYNTLRIFMNITRSIEPIIWAIIFSVWVGIGPYAGMLALMLHSISSLVKQYSEIIECVEDGPIEGVASTGASSLQVIWFAIVPQVVLPFISFTIFRWDINVRMATIIGLVGGGGIGNMLIQYQGQGLWREVGTLALLIVIVVWLMDAASTYLREAMK